MCLFPFKGPVSAADQQPPEAFSQETNSAFEEYAQRKAANIKQFGYGLFKAPPSTFAPVDIVPVGPDYILGPGDELQVNIWGKLNLDYLLVIDREGKIIIPQLGTLQLAGLSFSEAKTLLGQELSRYYKPSEVKMNVSMGKLRSLRVFVVGKAARPGSYTLSSLSTLVNALFAAGGPDKIGSMRDIQVNRAGKTIVHFDLYDLLLKGDKSKDIKLMPEDVIFIPPVGPLAGISGNVKSPAIYELKGETNAKDLIDLAGGFNEIAFKGRLQVDRIVNNNREIVFESPIDSVKPADIKIQPGDLINVFSIVQDWKIVRLSGAVQREGEYGAGDGFTVKDLINLAGGLKYYAYTEDAELTRVTATQKGPETEKIHLDLKKALEGDPKDNVVLRPDDYLFVRNVPGWDLYRTVTLNGEVKFPGRYTIVKGETISSLIERAGGFTDEAYLKGAVFSRESVRELQQKQLDEVIDRLEQELLSTSATSIQASLSPEDAKMQEVALAQKKTLLAKMRAAKAKGRISITLEDLDQFKGSPSDLALEEGDVLIIPARPAQVQVIGSVYNQTALIYKREASVASYLKKSGGLTKEADEDQIYVLKVDGTAISKREGGGWISGGFMSSRLDPGDTVVVPEKVEKVVWLREVKDITQILYQIAVTAGVLIVAF